MTLVANAKPKQDVCEVMSSKSALLNNRRKADMSSCQAKKTPDLYTHIHVSCIYKSTDQTRSNKNMFLFRDELCWQNSLIQRVTSVRPEFFTGTGQPLVTKWTWRHLAMKRTPQCPTSVAVCFPTSWFGESIPGRARLVPKVYDFFDIFWIQALHTVYSNHVLEVGTCSVPLALASP